jgi:AcrR family transcriptional regulator
MIRTVASKTPARREVKTATRNAALVRDRREQLIQAAVQVFGEKGFHNTTVRDIGRVSGLTQGTIYNYVRSKEDILFLVCDRIVSEYLHSVRRASVSDGDVVFRLSAALRGIVEVMIQHRSAILLLYHESHNLDRRSLRVILARVDEFIESFEQLLTEVSAKQSLATGNLRVASNILTFLPTIFSLRGWALPTDLPQSEMIDEVVGFMLRGLGFAKTA